MSEDRIDVRIRLRDALKFKKDAKDSARAVDEIGDAAKHAGRGLGGIPRGAKVAAVGLGAFSHVVGKAGPATLGLAEAAATLAGAGGAAGGVGLLALGQAGAAASLGLGDLAEALGGSEEAAKRLTPEARELFNLLEDHKATLKASAQAGLLPGLSAGAHKAAKNFGVLDRITSRTAKTLGGLADDAGDLLGSGAFGRDLAAVGGANVEIIDNLGHAVIELADGSRHLLTEAAPLARWLSEMALRGSQLTNVWIANKRETGELSRFFREAKTDLRLLASAGGSGAHGIINLFGSQDVDGTKTLQNLDRIMERFEKWTASPAVSEGLGKALVAELPDVVAGAADAIADAIVPIAGAAAQTFWDAFWGADIGGKALLGAAAASKLGVFDDLGKKVGKAAGITKGARGASAANPLYVRVVNGGGRDDTTRDDQDKGKGKKKGFLGGAWDKVEAILAGGAAGLATKAKGVSPGTAARGAARLAPPVALAAALAEVGQAVDKHLLNSGASRARDPLKDLTGKGPLDSLRDLVSSPAPRAIDTRASVRPIQITTKLVVDGRELAQVVDQHWNREVARGGGPDWNRKLRRDR